ncbi:MAG: hypothetical protein J7639_28470, partial [Paenibacillaceae bacterium]|nr:hypothetical protein [Paenibacillaceae bacterium]
MNSNFRNKWFFGVTLIAVGVVFLLHQNGVITFDMGRLISDFWPVEHFHIADEGGCAHFNL